DVGGFGVLSDGAIEGNSPNANRHGISEQDSGDPSGEGDGQRLSEELEEDVATAAAERFLDTDLARALSHGDEHDVHQSNAADAECKRADECEQNLEPGNDDAELLQLLHHVVQMDGALVVRLEVV